MKFTCINQCYVNNRIYNEGDVEEFDTPEEIEVFKKNNHFDYPGKAEEVAAKKKAEEEAKKDSSDSSKITKEKAVTKAEEVGDKKEASPEAGEPDKSESSSDKDKPKGKK